MQKTKRRFQVKQESFILIKFYEKGGHYYATSYEARNEEV